MLQSSIKALSKDLANNVEIQNKIEKKLTMIDITSNKIWKELPNLSRIMLKCVRT